MRQWPSRGIAQEVKGRFGEYDGIDECNGDFSPTTGKTFHI